MVKFAISHAHTWQCFVVIWKVDAINFAAFLTVCSCCNTSSRYKWNLDRLLSRAAGIIKKFSRWPVALSNSWFMEAIQLTRIANNPNLCLLYILWGKSKSANRRLFRIRLLTSSTRLPIRRSSLPGLIDNNLNLQYGVQLKGFTRLRASPPAPRG